MSAWAKTKERIATRDGNGETVTAEVHESGLFAVHRSTSDRAMVLTHLPTKLLMLPTFLLGSSDGLNKARLKAIAEILARQPKLWSAGEFQKPPAWTERAIKIRLNAIKAAIKTVKGETP